ncbi:AMP-binding protein [Pelagibius sp. Alg239-R121]|uniref:AMP-binding protein n=1 Tax=Pelagibius sp. Alg239-R121 TaxID=2993448 RepID=UPI0024A722EE
MEYSGTEDPESLKPRDGLSYVVGTRNQPLWRKTVPQVLADTALHHGARDAAVFPAQSIRWSYSELARKVDDLAAGLLAIGIESGDRVGIWSPNRPEWLLTQFATARIGAVLVTVNPAYRSAELEYVLNKVACKALVIAPAFKSSSYVEMITTIAPELTEAEAGRLSSSKLPFLRAVIVTSADEIPGMLRFDDLLKLAGPAQRLRLDDITAKLDPDDAINIQFTSGTTGSPKGATLTHYNIVNNARFVVGRLNLASEDRLAIPVPLYHCFGMVMGTLGCATVGAAMVFPSEAFDPETALKAVSRERCTAFYGVPTMFVAMLDHPEFRNHDLSSLRTGIMAGAPCPIEVMKRVIADMHMREITIAYGMTETSPVSFQSHCDDPLDRRVSTVGRIHPQLEVKIIDAEGHTVPVDQEGELCTRGYSVMRGYWNDDARTKESIDPAGWMHSGDLATLDREGYCAIVGRVKDMVIRGGENIYPREVEDFLHRHPKVQDVQVFGIPDPRYGEELCAWIVLKPGDDVQSEEITAFCKGQIAHYKVPRHIRFVEELPMTVTGKPQKFLMRERMVEELQR